MSSDTLVTNTGNETLTLRFEKKRIDELAIFLNFKNNVLPWSDVTRVPAGQYQQ
jgi:hypothetical protein